MDELFQKLKSIILKQELFKNQKAITLEELNRLYPEGVYITGYIKFKETETRPAGMRVLFKEDSTRFFYAPKSLYNLLSSWEKTSGQDAEGLSKSLLDNGGLKIWFRTYMWNGKEKVGIDFINR